MKTMQLRAVTVGLGAAIAAVGTAAIMSAATAPTARADDTSTIIADVSAIEAQAATAFSTASTDLVGGNESAGLTQLFIGLDDDLIGVPNFTQVALTDELQGVSVIPASDFEFTSVAPYTASLDFAAPTSITQSFTEAQAIYAEGTALITTITGLPTTDFADTALDNALSTIDQYILPEQIEAIANLAYAF